MIMDTKGHLELRALDIVFGRNGDAVHAVKDFSLEISPGEFVTVIGPSGCGKSTMLNAAAGFLRPSTGEILLDGQPIRGPGADRGMVFQQYSLFPWKTVRENVEFGMKMKGLDRLQRERTSRTLLGLAGLLAFENHYPEQLSGGMKQRVGIVRALATGPKVLLMDEPFGALDAQTRVIMQQILTNMMQQLRISVLFITHDLDEAIFLSDRVGVMSSRPGTLKCMLPVPLPRPRQPEMASSATYLALKAEIVGMIRDESLKAMGQEVTGMDGFSMKVGPDGLGALLGL